MGLSTTVNPKNGKKSPMISDSCYEAVMANEDRLNSAIIYDRDFSYVGFLFHPAGELLDASRPNC